MRTPLKKTRSLQRSSTPKSPSEKKADLKRAVSVRNGTDSIIKDVLSKAQKVPFPAAIEPMQATRQETPFNDPDYLYEVKWDGYRIVATIHKGRVRLYSRKGLDYTNSYPPVAKALSSLPYDAVIDGEVVVLNAEGKPDFDALQNYREGDPIAYYAFDLLWLEGYSLLKLSLLERRGMLEKIIADLDLVKLSAAFDDGIGLFNHVKELDLEGIVAKAKNSIYHPGKRVKEWVKIPAEIRQEFVIGGWTESDNGRPFRSLLFGYYDKGKLVYAGHAGGGFKEKDLPRILQRMKKLEAKTKPFVNEVDREGKVHWIKPELVAEIKYATTTRAGKIRKPAIFLGFREDKPATEVKKEIEVIPFEDEEKQPEQKLRKAKGSSNWPLIEKQKVISRHRTNIEGNILELTNLEKEVWKGITRAELIHYYYSVADYILPHLKDRPLSLHLKPSGPTAPGLYIKDMEGHEPEYATIFTTPRKHKKEGKRDQIDYIVCQNKATLLYLVNLGCIDLNPWSSRIASPLEPDFISIDLDPSDEDFSKVIEAALAAKEIFLKQKLTAFAKTSGKTGIHIYLPCSGFTYADARSIAENIAEEIHALLPGITTTEVSVNQRGNRVYLDPNQNDVADTLASAYSVRPYRLPTVSTPLEWREISQKTDPQEFTIGRIMGRINKKGDLFLEVLNPANRRKNLKPLKKFL